MSFHISLVILNVFSNLDRSADHNIGVFINMER